MQDTTDTPQPTTSLNQIETHLYIASLLALGALFIFLAVQRGLWVAPLRGDQSAHIYLGQLIMHGQRPYVDFAQFQPPLRLVITWLWSATASLLNTSIVETARVFCLAAALGTMIAIYGSATEMTASRIGGLVSAAAFVGLNLIVDSVVIGPNLKLFIMLFAAVGLWLAQRGRWLAAGALLGAATMMWLPAGVYVVAVGLATLLQTDEPRFLTLLRFVAGAAGVVLGLAIVLTLTGLLSDAVRQSLGGPFQELMRRGSGNASGPLLYFASRIAGIFRGEELFALLIISGIILTLVRSPRQASQSPRTGVPLLASAAILIALLQDFQGPYDLLPALPAILPFTAILIITALDVLLNRTDRPHLFRWTAAIAVVLAMLIYGYANRQFAFDRWDVDTLPSQKVMAAELDAALNAHEPVQVFDMLWFPVLSGRLNATPYAWTGGRINLANRINGVDTDQIAMEVQAARPTVVMIESSERLLPLDDWLEDDYKLMGKFYVQKIYVLRTRRPVRRIIDEWPLS